MKKIWLTFLVLAAAVSFSHAEMKCAAGKCGGGKCGAKMEVAKPKTMPKMFQSVSFDKATLLQDDKNKAFCPNCGMTLPRFYKTNHAAVVNGKQKQYCSMHCLFEDMQKGLDIKDIKVVDAATLKFIDAKSAHYVVGSNKPGTMSKESKYAFASEADVQAFAKENGGQRMTFGAALQHAEKSFPKECAMIGQKQDKMRMMGKTLYEKKCQKTDKTFTSIAEAKAFVVSSELCEDLDFKKLQAVGIYLGSR